MNRNIKAKVELFYCGERMITAPHKDQIRSRLFCLENTSWKQGKKGHTKNVVQICKIRYGMDKLNREKMGNLEKTNFNICGFLRQRYFLQGLDKLMRQISVTDY